MEDLKARAFELAANIVEDFSDTKSDAPEMPRDMQILGVAAAITGLIETCVTDAEREPLSVIAGLRRGTCWCEVGIGNPSARTHSQTCLAAQTYVAGVRGAVEDEADSAVE